MCGDKEGVGRQSEKTGCPGELSPLLDTESRKGAVGGSRSASADKGLSGGSVP